MKKFLSILLFLSIILTPTVVIADSKSYSIENLVVNSTISRNGDVYVEEELTYYFNGDFNGIYRNFSKKGADDITISQVLLKDDKGNEKILKGNQGSGNNYYELEDSSSLSKVKIYSKSSNVRKTFIFKYTIHGAVVKREDIGQLNWTFYEVENDVPVNNFQLNLSLKSEDFDMSIFKHWAYVDGKDLSDSYNEKGFKIKGKNLKGKLGVKVNFQPDYLDIPITKKGQGAIIGLIILAVVFIPVSALVVYIVRKEKRYKAAVNAYRAKYVYFNGDIITMPPSDMPPALVYLLFNKDYISTSVISATLLYLCYKGYYAIEKDLYSEMEFYEDEENQDLAFRRNYEKELPESPHLKYFIKWMSKYEFKGVLSLSAIQNKVLTRSGALAFEKSYERWENIIKKEAKELGFYVSIENRIILSNEYYDEKLKWQAYKKYLLKYVNNKNTDTIESIDEVLIYASVLIGSENQLQKLIDSINDTYCYSDNFHNSFFYYYYPCYMNNYSTWNEINGMWNEPNHDVTYDHSNGDGSGFGGFSSGSSFSGGGGGGSGAF